MNTYTVRLEFLVKSTDFANVEVEANSEAEARQAAKQLYFEGDCDLDYWSGEYIDTSLDTEFELDWEVTENEHTN